MKKIYSLLCIALIASMTFISCESNDLSNGGDDINVSEPTITQITTSATSFTFTITAPTSSSKYGYVVIEGNKMEDIIAMDILDKTLSSDAKSTGVYDSENLSKKEVYVGSCTPGATYHIYAAAVNGTSYSKVAYASADIISEEAPTVTLAPVLNSPYGFSYSVTPSENTYRYAFAVFAKGTEAPKAEAFFNDEIENTVSGDVYVLSMDQAPNGTNSAMTGPSDTKYIVYAAAMTEAGTYSEVTSLEVGTKPQGREPMADGVKFKEGVYTISYKGTQAATEENDWVGVTNAKSGEDFECRLFEYVSGVLDGKEIYMYLLQAKWFNIAIEGNNADYLEPFLVGIQQDNIILFDGMFAVMGIDPTDTDTYNKLYVAADASNQLSSAIGGIIAEVSGGGGFAFFGGGLLGMESIAITLNPENGEARDITDLSISHIDSSYNVVGTYDILNEATMKYVKENDTATIPAIFETPEMFFGEQPSASPASRSISSFTYPYNLSTTRAVRSKVTIIE